MRTSSKLAFGVAGLALAAAVAAQDRPESILPPDFGQPAAPAPANSSAPDRNQTAPPPAQPASPPDGGFVLPPDIGGGDDNAMDNASDEPAAPPEYVLPDYARRSLDRVGVSGADGLPPDAFGHADGRFLEALMRRIDAPVASRWLSIALRRALTSAVDTPARLNGADFAAERAWLLLRMGEAGAARAVVQGVDPENATPKLVQIAMQAALASGDPAGLCAYQNVGSEATHEAGWVLAKAMCDAMAGQPGQATAAVDAARRRGLGQDIDVALAEKVVGAGAQGRRAVTIEWPGVDRLTAWRWGLAAATGVEVPDDLMATAGPQVRYWRALMPIYAAPLRAPDAELAAGQGVLSNLALVDLYGEIDEGDDNAGAAGAAARDLRDAYTADGAEARLNALKSLWDQPKTELGKYGRLVLTARAAARLRPADAAAESDRLIAAMLTAGLDRIVRRWAGVAPAGGDGWAMLTLADPRRPPLSYGDVDDYGGGAIKQRMFFAGLAGLGRLSPDDVAKGASSLTLNLTQQTPWTRAIDAAARQDQPGTVLLLCAAGMQTRDWRGVDPAMLFRMVAALRATGLEGYGRMIAAEAIARLPKA